MSALSLQPWTIEEFFTWQEEQDERYELVDGFPMKMMTGASQRHDIIVVNVIAELRDKLRGKPCRTFTAGGSVRTKPGQIRRPDIGVDCGPADLDGYHATAPTVVFEVLSRSTRDFDRLRKIEEYHALPSLRHLVFLEAKTPAAVHRFRRDDGEWEEKQVHGIMGSLHLEAIGAILLMADIYEGLSFD